MDYCKPIATTFLTILCSYWTYFIPKDLIHYCNFKVLFKFSNRSTLSVYFNIGLIFLFQLSTFLFVLGMCDGYEYIYDLTQTEEVITGKALIYLLIHQNNLFLKDRAQEVILWRVYSEELSRSCLQIKMTLLIKQRNMQWNKV